MLTFNEFLETINENWGPLKTGDGAENFAMPIRF